MKTNNNWIPQPGDKVIWKKNSYTVKDCNLGGKCTLKKLLLPRRNTLVHDVDVSEIEKI